MGIINKKIASIVIIAVMVLASLAVSAETHADMSGPISYSFVVVTNPDGAEVENCDVSIIPNGTKLVVIGEYEFGKKLHIGKYGDYELCDIRSSDVVHIDTPTDISSFPKTYLLSQYILTEESYLYKGPGESYGRNDDNYHLPSGIIITSFYHDDFWMYVEYEGHAGWIYHLNDFQENPKTANVTTDEWTWVDKVVVPARSITLELKDTPFDDGKAISSVSVEPLTEIPVSYYFWKSKNAREVYVTYGQHSGWYLADFMTGDFAGLTDEYNERGLAARDTSLYQYIDSEESFYTIPAGTEYIASYYVLKDRFNIDKYYVTATIDSNTVEGWANGEDLTFLREEKEAVSVVDTATDEEPKIYTHEDSSIEIDEQIKKILFWSLIGSGVLAVAVVVLLFIFKKRKTDKDVDDKNELWTRKPVEGDVNQDKKQKSEELVKMKTRRPEHLPKKKVVKSKKQ